VHQARPTVILPRLQDFAGQWRMSRVITDHRARTTGQFDGMAAFTPDDGGLAYLEVGTLCLPGQPPFHAERRYLWRQRESAIDVHFDDGRFFHSVDPAHPTACHWCDPDTYDVIYSFASWPEWSSTWDVAGPRKAYKMVTSYSPTDPGGR